MKPTVQSIWDENELDEESFEALAAGRIWKLASNPWTPDFSYGDPVRDSVLVTAEYRARQVDDRHWRVLGFVGDGWIPVGWIVR